MPNNCGSKSGSYPEESEPVLLIVKKVDKKVGKKSGSKMGHTKKWAK
jgi:hypothetical protein